MPKSSFKHIPEEFRDEYYRLHLLATKIKRDLADLDIKSKEIIEKALKEINEEKVVLTSTLSKLDKAMNALHPTEPNEYNLDAGWKEKIIWVLKNANRVLPVATIVGKIRMIENDFDTALNPIIRLTIKRMQDKGEIVKYEEPNPSTIHYGLPEWFINNELIMDFHYLM